MRRAGGVVAVSPDRATDINQRLVTAWMARNQLGDAILPDLSDVSLTEAIEASRIVSERGAQPDPERPGWSVVTCRIEPTRVHETWLWAMAKWHEMEVETS